MIINKTLSILRWAGVMSLSLVGFLTAPIIFPILYPFRNTWVRNTKPFWFYFDDEDEFGFDVDWWVMNQPFNFWTAYKWAALRNPAWNLQASLTPGQSKQEIVSSKGKLRKNNRIASVRSMAVFKYVNAEGEYMGNQGEYLSNKYSILGSMFLWFTIKDNLHFRYSYAKQVSKKYWIEFQWGVTDNAYNNARYTFRLKIKKNLQLWKKN